MDKTYQKFLRSGLDLAPVGVERREDNTPYFCTPKGAAIFGWAGADGIHFCFIRGFGNTVFAVSPMSCSPDAAEFVHPLARDFSDFLRLLLALGDGAAPGQARMESEEQFAAFLREDPPTKEQEKLLTEIAEQFRLTPMERPWAYLKELQSAFDYGKLNFTEDYYDTVEPPPAEESSPPEWKVYFEGNFWGRHGKDRAGTEIPLGTEFLWGGRRWIIPAAYSCGKGLVIDLCMRVEPEEIQRFQTKWDLTPENDSSEQFSREQLMLMESENPLLQRVMPRLQLNGKPLSFSHGCSVCFNPCVPEGKNEPEAKWAAAHYGLEETSGWVISRTAFPWAGRRPEVKTLSLIMVPQPRRILGPQFKTHQPGEVFSFVHPVSGKQYLLTVEALERQTLPAEAFGTDRFYPTNTVAMSYTVTPEPEEQVTVCDCAEGDRPLELAPQPPFAPAAISSADVIGVIGGADGPTVVSGGGRPAGKLRTAFSSLRFEPVTGDIEWRVEFYLREYPEAAFRLLG